MNNSRLVFPAFSSALAILLGAFGAHYLKARLDASHLASFETGVRYHLIHSAVLFVIGLQQKESTVKPMVTFTRLIWLGILLFSGSIYLLSTRSLHQMEVSFLGPVTPVGGICLISAWVYAGIYYFNQKS